MDNKAEELCVKQINYIWQAQVSAPESTQPFFRTPWRNESVNSNVFVPIFVSNPEEVSLIGSSSVNWLSFGNQSYSEEEGKIW